ncbi:PP2C family protein-serine/threonine phosphatase [Streptomyces sp. NPDC090022]|uniref:PP2C family protein-serine/threonine phosphatase n=1 Tax=Streptomyces sp. NPDC090022 TaxID=3365920 RepID=UPI00380C8967
MSCGGTVAPDARCWDCGRPQPAFRAYLEVTAPGGAAGVCDRGLRRELNADALAVTRAGAWTIGVVCDGVSMAPRADRAAQVAAETGARALASALAGGALPEHALADAAVRAGRAVSALAAGPRSTGAGPAAAHPPGPGSAGARVPGGPGTPGGGPDSAGGAPACTYAAGIVGPEGVWTSWVGDSRAYWLPDEGPGWLLTEDDVGAYDALSAWLGADAGDPVAGLRSHRPSGPGRLLLCTDGLWRHLPDPASLRSALGHRRPADLLADARTLVGHALGAGGEDNITALLLPVAPDRPRP